MEFKTIDDVEQAMPDEASAKKYFANIRWGEWAKCPHCGNEKAYFVKNEERYKCASKVCRKKFSVTSQSIIEATKTPLNEYAKVIWLYAKTRGRCSHYEIINTINCAGKTSGDILQRLTFAWKYVDREGKTNHDVFNDLIKTLFDSFELYKNEKEKPFKTKPNHVSDIDDISDVRQYNKLLKYTDYYMNVYCHWIFVKFASPQDILSEAFLYMQSKGIKDYNTESILKLIRDTVGRLWIKWQSESPKHHDRLRIKNKQRYRDRIKKVDTCYAIKVLQGTKDWKGVPAIEIRKHPEVIEWMKERIKAIRKAKGEATEFNSHFS